MKPTAPPKETRTTIKVPASRPKRRAPHLSTKVVESRKQKLVHLDPDVAWWYITKE
jgi:hypothetical protein